MAGSTRGKAETLIYDDFRGDGGYGLTDYLERWDNIYGPGEMADGDTRRFDDGVFSVSATPFRTGADNSVFDHIKYFAVSRRTFAAPETGSLTVEAEIEARTPGVERGRVIQGVYGPSGAWPNGKPWSAELLDAQQACVTLHMIDFETGLLFDWLVAETRAVCLVERLPSSVTGSSVPVGRDLMHTQIIAEHEVTPGPHRYSIQFFRGGGRCGLSYCIDGREVSRIHDVGVPLDRQGVAYTGRWPSMGPGEDLTKRIGSFSVAHGLFSLLDAFPFQHEEAPELSVSVPMEQRLFGQGAAGRYRNITIVTQHD